MDSFSEEFLKADENEKKSMRCVQLIKKDGTVLYTGYALGRYLYDTGFRPFIKTHISV